MRTGVVGRASAAVLGFVGLYGITACHSPIDLSNRAIDFNETAAEAADTQLLLNIVRASFRNPTHYTAISQIREARVRESSFQVSGQFPFGPKAVSIFPITPIGTVRSNEQPSFDVAPLDTKAAAHGLLRPIEPQTMITYWRQGWPKTVLLFLFVDDVVLNEAALRACNLPSTDLVIDNNAYNYANFQRIRQLFECIGPAIALREAPKETRYITRAAIPPTEILKKLPELQKDDFTVKEEFTAKGQRLYSISKQQKKLTFTLSFRGQQGSARVAREGDSKVVRVKNEPSAVFTIRSVDSMIYYLGEVVRSQLRGDPPPLIKSRDGYDVLFRVDLDQARRPGQQIEVDYLGQRFSISRIPQQDDRSLTVLTLLTQLFSLYRENTDLPRTTAVQIVGSP